jgi:hypothetical protein
LDSFFNVENPDKPHTQVVTKSALSQACKQLSHTAIIDPNRHAVDAYYAAYPEFKTKLGFLFCAIDGSQFRVSDESDIVNAFGANPGKENQKDCQRKNLPRC